MFDCVASLARGARERGADAVAAPGLGRAIASGMTKRSRSLWIVGRVLAIVGVGVACGILIGLFGELDRQVLALSSENPRFSLADVSSPLALLHTEEWQGWGTFQGEKPGPLIGLHLLLDIIYMATYGLLFLLIIDAFQGPERAAAIDDDKLIRRRRRLRSMLVVALGIDVIEDAGLLIGAFLIGSGSLPPWAATEIAVVTTLKWIALGVLGAGIVVHIVCTLCLSCRLRLALRQPHQPASKALS
jgi:hypothetical protein